MHSPVAAAFPTGIAIDAPQLSETPVCSQQHWPETVFPVVPIQDVGHSGQDSSAPAGCLVAPTTCRIAAPAIPALRVVRKPGGRSNWPHPTAAVPGFDRSLLLLTPAHACQNPPCADPLLADKATLFPFLASNGIAAIAVLWLALSIVPETVSGADPDRVVAASYQRLAVHWHNRLSHLAACSNHFDKTVAWLRFPPTGAAAPAAFDVPP